jgi:hypothetical protein
MVPVRKGPFGREAWRSSGEDHLAKAICRFEPLFDPTVMLTGHWATHFRLADQPSIVNDYSIPLRSGSAASFILCSESAIPVATSGGCADPYTNEEVRMYKLLFPVTLVLALISRAGAQQFAFPESASQDPATLSKALVTLAGQALAVYKDDDREKYLVNLSALQSLEGQYPEAVQSFVALYEAAGAADAGFPMGFQSILDERATRTNLFFACKPSLSATACD